MNKGYLLDTHVFLWSLEGSNKLPGSIIEILENENNQIFISTASLWEMAIKIQIKKLQLPKNIRFQKIIEESGFELLNIKTSHIEELRKLKTSHRDPFDHLIIAQAKSEKFTLITHDQNFKKYFKKQDLLLF